MRKGSSKVASANQAKLEASMSTALESTEQKVIARSGDEMVSMIERMVKDPGVDIDKLERLIALKERVDAQSRREEYDQALARVQETVPRVTKSGRISISASNKQSFATLEDVDTAIRPLMAAEGFALSFDTSTQAGRITVSGTLKHRSGHSETKQVELPTETSGSKNAVQAVGSTVSYGRRYLLKMFFNLVEVAEDSFDGNPPREIQQKDADTIRDLLAESGADKARFLKYMGVVAIDDIDARDVAKAISALRSKIQHGDAGGRK